MSKFDEFIESRGDEDSKAMAEALRSTSLEEFHSQLRASNDVDPVMYLNTLEGLLKWPLLDFSADNIQDNLSSQPLHYWIDEHGEEHPIFINSIVSTLSNSKDEMLFKVLDMISDGYDEEFEKPVLLFGAPVFKKINGQGFSVIGVWNNGDGWRWLFLSKLEPWEQLNAYQDSLTDELQNSLGNPSPPEELAEFTDKGHSASLIYHCIVKPMTPHKYDAEKESGIIQIEERMVVSGVGGWSSYV